MGTMSATRGTGLRLLAALATTGAVLVTPVTGTALADPPAGCTTADMTGVMSGVSAALAGYLLLDGAPPGVVAFANALAAGAILSMITDTMIPEAFEKAAVYSGLIATLGFLAAFSLHSLG